MIVYLKNNISRTAKLIASSALVCYLLEPVRVPVKVYGLYGVYAFAGGLTSDDGLYVMTDDSGLYYLTYA